jgi:hypothetical protein
VEKSTRFLRIYIKKHNYLFLEPGSGSGPALELKAGSSALKKTFPEISRLKRDPWTRRVEDAYNGGMEAKNKAPKALRICIDLMRSRIRIRICIKVKKSDLGPQYRDENPDLAAHRVKWIRNKKHFDLKRTMPKYL